MKIDGNELAILQNDLDRRGQKQEAWKVKQEFLKHAEFFGFFCGKSSPAGPGERGSLSLSGEVPAPWQLL